MENPSVQALPPAKPGQLDPNSGAERQSTRPLRRASVACISCRDRRIKCDGDSGDHGESCSQCRIMNRSCVFRFDDRRKRGSSKAYLRHLQDRIAALEHDRSLNHSSTRDGSVSAGSIPNLAEQQSAHLGSCSESHNSPPDHRYDCPRIPKILPTNRDFGLLRTNSVAHSLSLRSASLHGGADHRLDRLGSTRGNLSSDEYGQLHYFGYTSNLQVLSFLPTYIPPPSPSSPGQSEEIGFDTLADSKETQEHLLKLYFMYQHPSTLVLDEETFLNGCVTGVKTQYFSSFLLYSILLRSLRLSDKPAMQDLAGIYLQRARAELLVELESPTIATVQALCIFGQYLGSLGNDRACWLYPGIAYRLIYDLGLHRDCMDLVSAGYLTENDRKVRHITLWGCYTLDKLYSFFQGRPASLRLSDITVPRPNADTVGGQHQLLSAWGELTMILDDIINVVNGPADLMEQEGTLANLSEACTRLLKWLKELPLELQWDPKKASLPTPGICALHMQFLTITILLHRPFATYLPDSQSHKRSAKHLEGYSPALSQQICTVNAIRISKLLVEFQQQYGIEKFFSTVVHMALTAALSLISEISTEAYTNEKAREKKWLAVCLDVLKDLSLFSTVAGRNLIIVKSILQECGYSELASLTKSSHITDDTNERLGSAAEPIELQGLRNENLPEIPTPEMPNYDDLGNAEMDVDPTMGSQDFGHEDFFPQLMQSFNMGNWVPERTAFANMNNEPSISRNIPEGDPFVGLSDFMSDLYT